MTTSYGIISDMHEQDPRVFSVAVDLLKKEGAEALILNGDIVGDQSGLEEEVYLAYILQVAGKSGLETFVQPGSHEEHERFDPVVKAVSKDYENIISTLEYQKIKMEDHELVFLPGSDWHIASATGKGYDLTANPEFESAIYPTDLGTQVVVRNMNDLKKYVTDPEKTIVVCHIPQKFENPHTAGDMAYFAQKQDGSLMPGIVLENMIRQQCGNIPYRTIKEIASKNGYTLKKENRGNEDLRKIYKELGIRKAINGHFHESSHRANDWEGNPVQENEFVEELFWNASYFDAVKIGLLTVDGNKVAYENIDLNDHLE